MKLTSTKSGIKYVKALIYGPPKIGKTVLGSTAPSPLIVDAERGLLSLSDKDLPVVEIDDFDDLQDVYDKLCKKKFRKHFETVVIDSASEVCEFVLSDLKKEMKDGRAAYMALGEKAIESLRMFRDLPMHVVYICKERRVEMDGIDLHWPSFPGQALAEKVPYLVDEILALRITDDEDENYRYVQTQPSSNWTAGDRSGSLNYIEEPNLSKIFKKILKGKKKRK